MPNYSHGTKLTLASAEEPPYLTVGTDVSAKYKGAFCEAKIIDVNKHVKLRVLFDGPAGSYLIDDTDLKQGSLLATGTRIEARHPEKKQQTYVPATITKILDHSRYTVVFDDGDQCILRRNSLCLKSGKHFAESETLDQLPLTNPEHFGNPVKVGAQEQLDASNNATQHHHQNNNASNKSQQQHNNHLLLNDKPRVKSSTSTTNSSSTTSEDSKSNASESTNNPRKRQYNSKEEKDSTNDNIKLKKLKLAKLVKKERQSIAQNNTGITTTATARRGSTKGGKRRESVNNGSKNAMDLDDNSVDSSIESGDVNPVKTNVKFELIEVGVKLMVQYGKGKIQNYYEAKVNKIETNASGNVRYFVHYTGWNNRYDEWITKNRIHSIVIDKENGSRDGRSRHSEVATSNSNSTTAASSTTTTTTTTASSSTNSSTTTITANKTEPKEKEKEKEVQPRTRRARQTDIPNNTQVPSNNNHVTPPSTGSVTTTASTTSSTSVTSASLVAQSVESTKVVPASESSLPQKKSTDRGKDLHPNEAPAVTDSKAANKSNPEIVESNCDRKISSSKRSRVHSIVTDEDSGSKDARSRNTESITTNSSTTSIASSTTTTASSSTNSSTATITTKAETKEKELAPRTRRARQSEHLTNNTPTASQNNHITTSSATTVTTVSTTSTVSSTPVTTANPAAQTVEPPKITNSEGSKPVQSAPEKVKDSQHPDELLAAEKVCVPNLIEPPSSVTDKVKNPQDIVDNPPAEIHSRPTYRFCDEIDESDCDKKISILQERIMALRQTYTSLKTELADLDRRKKRPRTERSNSDHINNCSVVCRS